MTDYISWRSFEYFLIYLGEKILSSGAAYAFLWTAIALLIGVFLAFMTLILVPRIIEDYVKIYNWYVNSDFYIILEEKVDVRMIFKVLGLPILLVLTLFFLTLNLIVRTAYQLAAKLNLLFCVNCESRIDWREGTVICHVCSEKVTGTPTKSCPGCNFKANSVRCPYCGYVNFVELFGHHPSGRAGKGR